MTPHRNRYLVELQGYCGLTDREVCEFDPWLRLRCEAPHIIIIGPMNVR